jgi:hypothetical protein
MFLCLNPDFETFAQKFFKFKLLKFKKKQIKFFQKNFLVKKIWKLTFLAKIDAAHLVKVIIYC